MTLSIWKPQKEFQFPEVQEDNLKKKKKGWTDSD